MPFAIIKYNTYYDSVSLMIVTSEITKIPGVVEASVCMGTELNKGLLVDRGLSNAETDKATSNDLIIAYETSDGMIIEEIQKTVENLLKKKSRNEETNEATYNAPISLKTGMSNRPDSNLAIISVPGRYAYIEAQKALLHGLNVMLFSDNVTLDEEKKLKEYASKKGLLMMGPDCGTSIINGKGLCFSNEIRKGNIGVVGASGTGIQEVTVLIDRFGGGITHAIGVGGRDLSDEIGGIMMLDGLSALAQDKATEIVLLLSKQPSEEVAAKIVAAAENCGKPVVICFLGYSKYKENSNQVCIVSTFEQAAFKALELAGVRVDEHSEDLAFTEAYAKKLLNDQKYVVGLFSGGSLCSESKFEFNNCLGQNLPTEGHAFLDLGDDQFTVGRPHPMIDPTLRNKKIVEMAGQMQTSVIILDFVIGYGAHENPAGVAIKAIEEAKTLSDNLVFVAYVCGTENDFQGLQKQRDILSAAGVIVSQSNAQAARIAAEVIRRKCYECQ